jgi:hypothetical protein
MPGGARKPSRPARRQRCAAHGAPATAAVEQALKEQCGGLPSSPGATFRHGPVYGAIVFLPALAVLDMGPSGTTGQGVTMLLVNERALWSPGTWPARGRHCA